MIGFKQPRANAKKYDNFANNNGIFESNPYIMINTNKGTQHIKNKMVTTNVVWYTCDLLSVKVFAIAPLTSSLLV